MSMYWILFIVVISLTTLTEYCTIKIRCGDLRCRIGDREMFSFLFFIMMVFLALRYGQGTDYFHYKYIYDSVPKNMGGLSSWYFSNAVHGEIGWKFITHIFSLTGLDFQCFIILLSIVEMSEIKKFITRCCGHARCFSLLWLFPVFYLIYLFSALRQGLATSIFVGTMLPLLEKKKYIRYLFMTAVVSTIHIGAIIYLFVYVGDILSKHFKSQELECCCWTISISALVFAVIFRGGGTFVPSSVLIHTNLDISIGAVLRRLIFMMQICTIYHKLYNKSRTDRRFYDAYMIQCLIFFLFSGMSLLGSRLFEMLGSELELYFLAKYFTQERRHRKRLSIVAYRLFLILYILLMFIKNMDANIAQGTYVSDVNVYNFPYVSIFDRDAIFSLRTYTYR